MPPIGSSTVVMARPSIGRTPITVKNPPVTSPAGICSAAPIPVSAYESLSNAATSVNAVLSRRQSV